jgi:hypothetical protein
MRPAYPAENPRKSSSGEPQEVLLVDAVEHLDDGTLKDLVLHSGNSQRSLPPVRLRDVHSPRRSRPVRAPVDPRVKIAKVGFEILCVVLPRHPVHPSRGLRVQRPEGLSQAVDVDVMQERGEPRILVLLCDSAHAIQRTWHAHTGTASGAWLAVRVLLAQASFLPRLRRRHTGIVRQVRRYYRPVRLPTLVHLGITALAFPERPALPSRRRATVGSPGSRTWRFGACSGSSTARGPLAARDNAASDMAFRL